MSELTLCICARNEEANLDRLMESLWKGEGPPILVVDHGSTDRTPILLDEWKRRRSGLSVARFTGKGIAAARNFAISRCRTEWIAFVDADCELSPDWLERALASIEAAGPEEAGIGGNALLPGGNRGIFRGYALSLRSFVGGHGSSLNRLGDGPSRADYLPTYNVLFKRERLEAVGGFDESFARGAEDLDLGFRLRGKGERLVVNPEILVTHHLTGSWRGWARKMFRYGMLRCDFSLRRGRTWCAPFLAPLLLLSAMAVAWAGGAWPGAIVSVLYLCAVVLALSPEVLRQRASPRDWMMGVGVTAITHVAFGAGIAAELLARVFARRAPAAR